MPRLTLRFLPTCVFICSVLVPRARGQETATTDALYYRGRTYGSEALYNPINLVLNGSFDIDQLDGYSHAIAGYRYAASARGVFASLGDPFGAISHYGWGRFLRVEILPLTWTKEAAWWPNYQLHLIGGGMSFVAMREWYAFHSVACPGLWSLGTMAVYHLLNEIRENEVLAGRNPGTAADIYLFDVGGILLFSNDDVARFFSRDLHLADWSLQPSISLRDGTLRNAGQYFSVRWSIPFANRWSLFYYFGMNGLGGLSRRLDDGGAVSAGVGLRAALLTPGKTFTTEQSAELVWNAGIFYDYDGSLLASVFASGLTSNLLTVNLYPGLFSLGPVSPGVWVTFAQDYSVSFGVTTRWAPGLSLIAR